MNIKTTVLLLAAAIVGCSSDYKRSDLTFEQAPLAVRMGIEKAYPDATVKEIVKKVSKDDGAVTYEVKLTTRDSEKKKSEFAADGELLDKKRR